MALDEPEDQNPIRARVARRRAGAVFGSKPGAYGAGLQALIDERLWDERADLGAAYLDWGGYAYGRAPRAPRDATPSPTGCAGSMRSCRTRTTASTTSSTATITISSRAALAAAVEALQGRARPIWHNDHSRPERPVDPHARRRDRRAWCAPAWSTRNGSTACMRHGYKGAFEMAATVDYLFAFAATTGAVRGPSFRSGRGGLSGGRGCARLHRGSQSAGPARDRRAAAARPSSAGSGRRDRTAPAQRLQERRPTRGGATT